MSQQKKKPTAPKIDWHSILISMLADFFIGTLLILIDKLIG